LAILAAALACGSGRPADRPAAETPAPESRIGMNSNADTESALKTH